MSNHVPTSEEEKSAENRRELMRRYAEDDLPLDLHQFDPLPYDLEPRFDDIDIIERGLDRPKDIPRLARAYSEQHFGGKAIPPFQYRRAKKRGGLFDRLAREQNSDQKKTVFRSPFELSLSEMLKPEALEQRSVIFMHHAYYHFYYLAQALRDRGWNAWSVSTEDPNGPNASYYHGEDLNIFSADPNTASGLQYELFDAVSEHFQMLFFHADSRFSIFDTTQNFNSSRDGIGFDFLELKSRGVKIGHSISGCNTGQRPSVFNKVSQGCCNKCVWQGNASVCSEAAQYLSGKRIEALVDLYALEIDFPGDFSRRTEKCFRDPLIYCLQEDMWHPDIVIPDRIERFKRKPGEVLVFHAVGNYDTRDGGGRNLKGTPAVLEAMDRLKTEGHNVRLIFKTGVPSREMRFYQIQADIIVDQLNYGRYGATARECMSLGLPTICRMDREQPGDIPPSPALAECPLVNADESTVYEAIKDLVVNEEKRLAIGRASREYAVKWHSASACAERFEKVYDRVMAGNYPLDVPEIYDGSRMGDIGPDD